MQRILQKLRARAHAALATSHPQQSGATAGPQIKTEADELSALGGMTRLVERRSSGSPSYSGSSPASQSASPQPLPPSQAQDAHHSFSEAANTWQNYGPVHQSYSDQYSMQQTHTQVDPSMMYNGQQHGTPLETMPAYYGYTSQSGYAMQPIAQSPNMTPSPNHHYVLPADSWQNFIAQFKQ